MLVIDSSLLASTVPAGPDNLANQKEAKKQDPIELEKAKTLEIVDKILTVSMDKYPSEIKSYRVEVNNHIKLQIKRCYTRANQKVCLNEARVTYTRYLNNVHKMGKNYIHFILGKGMESLDRSHQTAVQKVKRMRF